MATCGVYLQMRFGASINSIYIGDKKAQNFPYPIASLIPCYTNPLSKFLLDSFHSQSVVECISTNKEHHSKKASEYYTYAQKYLIKSNYDQLPYLCQPICVLKPSHLGTGHAEAKKKAREHSYISQHDTSASTCKLPLTTKSMVCVLQIFSLLLQKLHLI